MPDMSLLIDPKTGEEYLNVPATVAAKFLGVALTFVYAGLQQQRLPIGSAAQGGRGTWCYSIPCERLKAYALGASVDIQTLAQTIAKEIESTGGTA